MSQGPDRGRMHQPITQSRSVPVLLESERVARARGEYQQQQTLPPQLRAQASFVPDMQYRQEQRLPPQAHAHVQPHPLSQAPPRSHSMHGFSDPNLRGSHDSRRNFEDSGRMEAGGYSASSSRPSTARSALYVGPGAEDADQYNRKSVMALPASGGVFPRYQEVAGPYSDASVRPGSSGGRFKSLFKSRDSRVFK
ncbi:hypothetical protein M408DRAFT_111004 [Serendipita vermifera MAFF 305830]|uniref:Uncharacterized protein n=1 Tax=Serendipita vermifera MAFF 305830 TaxID=933852 RepID=A0A0C3AIR0_SERVB|nr:hypothetical protein M408DRAFT_168484 [Serendipita vermifera MAFF 305830]KIM21126.1 hypothetical protein M408DRAFT_111004 [Serendipita vermifera MAFF 305830]